MKKSSKNFIRMILVLLVGLYPTNNISAQTIKEPILIKVMPVTSEIVPGGNGALEVSFKIPSGFWLGDNDHQNRMPPPTLLEVEPIEGFHFGKPLFPEAKPAGVPVKKGVTRMFEGEVVSIIPFSVDKNIKEGKYKIKVLTTYTPGLNAGRLTSHVNEEYETEILVKAGFVNQKNNTPQPQLRKVPGDFIVEEEITKLPEPLNTILYRWPEESFVAKFLHWVWIDPDNHGKHVQTVFTPFYGFTENNGYTAGMGMSLMNLTREGIMTGQIQLRGFYNEYVGATLGFEAVSCPAAYHNYWVSGFLSSDGKNKGINIHIENLNFGNETKFGYELFADFFRDPRFRFYGVGADAKEEDKTNYTHQENSALLDLFWMPVDKIRFTVGGKVRNVDVLDGNDKIRNIMPWTNDFTNPGGKFENIPGIKGATVYGGRVSIIYDGRNSEFTPSAGFYGRVIAEYNHISDQVVTTSSPIENYGKFYVDLREYISTADQRLTLLLRNSWTLTTDENIPFFEQAKLGGDFSNRAFDNGRFYGQHSVFASMEIRIQTMSIVFMGVPMDLEMAPFLDAGQVFSDAEFKGRFNVNPGMSIRILNRPNLGIVGNAAIGQDGLIFTGGVTLPF
ncbi:BamA/TamA family outer membrane protein [Ignavibacterium sp.]|uniref:BamA/TamA family outer membrane protein n=1 Tax=Ignavibacterium sp. TaxID=2651167 RepID=UPI00307D6F67